MVTDEDSFLNEDVAIQSSFEGSCESHQWKTEEKKAKALSVVAIADVLVGTVLCVIQMDHCYSFSVVRRTVQRQENIQCLDTVTKCPSHSRFISTHD